MTALEERARFITDFARRLHLAGVSAARLEGAVKSTATAIGVDCEIWSSPTGILLSLGDPTDPSATQQTRVLRLDPAEPNLSDLSALDAIAEQVIAGKLDVVEASQRLRALDRAPDSAESVVGAVIGACRSQIDRSATMLGEGDQDAERYYLTEMERVARERALYRVIQARAGHCS